MVVFNKQIFHAALLTFLFLFSLNDGLRITLGAISWVPAILIAFMCFKPRLIFGIYSVLWFFFIALVLWNSSFSENPVNSLGRALKLIFIFLLLSILYRGYIKKEYALFALRFSIIVTVLANFILISLSHLFGLETVAWEGGGGRWETLLARPGTLYYSGAAFMLIFLHDLFFKSNYLNIRKIFGFVLVFMSIALITSDGSRTAVLGLLITVLILFASSKRSSSKYIFLVIIIITTIPIINYLFINEVVDLNRIYLLFNSSSLKSTDSVRFFLLEDSLEWISSNNPIFIGRGFSSTISATGFELVVHNAFILVWEKLGLIALVSFVLFVFMPVSNFLTYSKYNPLEAKYLALCFWFMFFVNLNFHPLSTEYGPWFFYAISILFLGLNKNREDAIYSNKQ